MFTKTACQNNKFIIFLRLWMFAFDNVLNRSADEKLRRCVAVLLWHINKFVKGLKT